MRSQPFHLQRWIDENRHLLKPPVGNLEVFPGQEFIVMVVAGPNRRKDFHIDPGPEIFYQLEGEITLRILQDGLPSEVKISQGEIYFLAPTIPHSPQRPENTLGLVIERKRASEEKDGFLWICDRCHSTLHTEWIQVSDIVKQLPAVFDQFYGHPDRVRCPKCGTIASR